MAFLPSAEWAEGAEADTCYLKGPSLPFDLQEEKRSLSVGGHCAGQSDS